MDLNLEKMQKILVEGLVEVDRICKENNIRYYLIGGTMLGAVRHQGFIPWDDDIDIGMPREDYNKFIRIAPDNLNVFYEIQNYDKVDYHPYNYLKLIDKRTLLIQESLQHLNAESGVFIDIFPLDGVPRNKVIRLIHNFHVRLYKVILFNYYYSEKSINSAYIENKVPYWKRSLQIIRMRIIKRIFSFANIKKIHIKLDEILSKYKFDDSIIAGNYLGAWGSKELMIMEYYGKARSIMFENKEFLGVENPDAYLKSIYVDYWRMPPVEERKSHHKFAMLKMRDLNLHE